MVIKMDVLDFNVVGGLVAHLKTHQIYTLIS